MNNKLKKVIKAAVGPLAFALPFLTLADVATPPLPTGNAITLNEIIAQINNIATILMVVGITIGVIFVVYGGIKYMLAGGDPAVSKKARAAVIDGFIGIAVILAVGVIIRTAGALVTRSFFTS